METLIKVMFLKYFSFLMPLKVKVKNKKSKKKERGGGGKASFACGILESQKLNYNV